MQVNSTLIAAQQAAREAQARFRQAHAAPQTSTPQASFATALNSIQAFTPPVLTPGPAPAQTQAPAQSPAAPAPGRPGSLLDITV